jgi:hypothetical protein
MMTNVYCSTKYLLYGEMGGGAQDSTTAYNYFYLTVSNKSDFPFEVPCTRAPPKFEDTSPTVLPFPP